MWELGCGDFSLWPFFSKKKKELQRLSLTTREGKREGDWSLEEKTGLLGRGEQRERRCKVNKKAQELSCDFRGEKVRGKGSNFTLINLVSANPERLSRPRGCSTTRGIFSFETRDEKSDKKGTAPPWDPRQFATLQVPPENGSLLWNLPYITI